MKEIELSMNGYYLATTTRHKTCKEAVAYVRDIAKHRPLKIAGRGKVKVRPEDRIEAHFVK